jgi:multicomponent Na+:H+ antiporter subunit G
MVVEIATLILVVTGAGFFFAGTVGIFRFPDAYSRLHAVTKADNLGLGFIVLGLAFSAGSPLVAAKLALIWLLTLVAAATAAHLVADTQLRREDAGVDQEHER